MNRRVLWPTREEGMAALVSAILFAVAFPPFPLVLPVFVALVPLAVAVARNADGGVPVRSSIRIGFWFAVLAFGANLYWIAIALSIYTKLAFLGYAGTLAGLGPIIAAAVAALHAVRRATRLPMAVLLPVVWVSSEVLLNYLSDLSFPWLPLGLSMARVPLLAQAADLSGVRGLSVWIAATNGLMADAWLLRAHRAAVLRRAGIAVGLAAAVAAYGAWRLESTELVPVAPVAVVQPNIPQEEKWQEENQDRIVGILASATRAVTARGEARLVVWPEVALPGYLVQHPAWVDTLQRLARAGRTPILFGVLDVEYTGLGADDYEYFNAAKLVDARGVLDAQPSYHKTYLVPIVERVPFVNPRWFSGLRYFGGYGRGGDPALYGFPWGRVGMLICYESIFPQRSREYRREGATLIVNITNDAWFGRSLAPHQHLAHLVLRAVENRVGIVRAANTGISGFIDPLGRVHGATDLFVRAARTYEPYTSATIPLYVRVGDWAGMLSVAATVALLGYAAYRRRRP